MCHNEGQLKARNCREVVSYYRVHINHRKLGLCIVLYDQGSWNNYANISLFSDARWIFDQLISIDLTGLLLGLDSNYWNSDSG